MQLSGLTDDHLDSLNVWVWITQVVEFTEMRAAMSGTPTVFPVP
jgi:hypothetical protein